MPAGTKCTGGTSKNLCLASFVTTAGFGNCVAVSQGSQGSNNDATPATSNNSGKNAAKGKVLDNTADNKTETATGDKNNQKCNSAGSNATNATRRSASFKRKCEFCLELAPTRNLLTICQPTQGLPVNRLGCLNWNEIRFVISGWMKESTGRLSVS